MSERRVWLAENQRYLWAEIARVRNLLAQRAELGDGAIDQGLGAGTLDTGSGTAHPAAESGDASISRPDQDLDVAVTSSDVTEGDAPALDSMAETFVLSPFERDLLLFCAAAELDPTVPALCGRAAVLYGIAASDPSGSHHPQMPHPQMHHPQMPHPQMPHPQMHPTFSLALTLFPNPHWSALSPSAALRYWRLIETPGEGPLTTRPLRIDERVLHHLIGVDYIDERLAGLVRPVASMDQAAPEAPAPRTESAHAPLAIAIMTQWRDGSAPLGVQLYGDDTQGQQELAEEVARLSGARLYVLHGEDVPTTPHERETFARLWDREAALSPVILLLVCRDEPHSAAVARPLPDLISQITGPLIVTSREPLDTTPRSLNIFEVSRPRWLRSHLRLRPGIEQRSVDLSRLGLAGLAQRIKPLATWDDLVLPPEQVSLLREVAAQVRHLFTVYETWGFARKSSRGLGVSAMFAGQSGTGKTMAAEVLANELGLDLYRIDLSAVVSKYIGETEKNLRRVFDAAEGASAILLFDEADALFGKRSEVKDSHDRYANIEVSYLLQRMEQYAGLAILTTNFKSALDPAFLRRIRFVVNFPFPDAGQRAEIWRRVFPPEMPRNGVDISRLMRLGIAGGNIRNIALNAAFLAADAGEPVSMPHVLRAVRAEYAKIEKPLSEVELVSRS